MIKVCISLTFGAFFVWLSLRGINLTLAAQSLRRIDWWFLPCVGGVIILLNLLRSLRLKLFLGAFGKEVTTLELFGYNSVGYLFITLLPLRLGEFVIPYILKRDQDIAFTSALSIIALERLVDLFVLLVLLLCLMLNVVAPSWLLQSGVVLGVLLITALLLLVIIYKNAHLVWKMLLPLRRLLPGHIDNRVKTSLQGFRDGFRIIYRPRIFLKVILLSLVIWFFSVLAIHFSLRLMYMPHTFVISATVMVINVIGVSIPAGPGMIGNFQYAIMLALGLFNVEKTSAFVFANAYYLISLIMMCALGLAFMTRVRIGVDDFRKFTRPAIKE